VAGSISYAGKGVSESTEVYRAWKAAEGYPKYLEHVCGKDGSVKLVKKQACASRFELWSAAKESGHIYHQTNSFVLLL